MTAICNVETSQRRRRGVFDDPFFNSMFKETQRKFIESDTLSINVKPYPVNPPADFTGAVGDFSINTWIDTLNAKVNEAVTLHVELNGTGNLNQFKINQLNFPQSMEVFPPKSSFSRDEFRDQITGKQKFEYILIPRQSGSFQLNPISLVFFNPKNERFETARSKVIKLNVDDSGKSIIAYPGLKKEDVNIIADDIRFIKTNNIKMYSPGSPISIWIFSPFVLSFALFLFPSVYGRFTHLRGNSLESRINKKALKTALKDLKKTEAESLSYVTSVMYRYFKSKLFLQTDNLDPLTLENSLKSKISSDHLKKVITLAKKCDANRFSRTSSGSTEKIIEEISSMLIEIDKMI